MKGQPSRIAKARQAAGLTQQELADTAGISKSLVCRVEQGTHTNMTVDTARALAKALEMDLAAFLGLW